MREVFIQEAIRKAMECGGRITCPDYREIIQIEPTDSDEGFILHGKEQAPGPRWQPRAKDLLADDWEVTKEVWT